MVKGDEVNMSEYMVDVDALTERKSKVYSLIEEIQNEKSYLKLTKRYFEVYKIKENKPHDEIGAEYIDFVCDVVDEKFGKVSNARDVQTLRNNVTTLSWRLKTRWVKACVESLDNKRSKFIKKEYEDLQKEYVKYDGEILRTDLNIKKPEEIIEYRTKTLKEWASSVECPITDFPYLEELSLSKIKSAFTHDLVLCITNVLKEKYKYDLNNMVVKNVSGLPTGLFAPLARGVKKNVMNVQKTQELSYESKVIDTKGQTGSHIDVQYSFSLNDDGNEVVDAKDFNKSEVLEEFSDGVEPLKILLVNKETEKKAMPKIFLDKQDLAIIRFAFGYQILNSYKLPLSEILDHLNIKKNKENYKRIKDRLLKLPYYTFYTKKLDDSGEIEKETTFNLFQSISIEKDVSGRLLVEVKKATVDEIEKRGTEILYRKELQKLKTHQATDLAFFLEGRRVQLITTGCDVKSKYYKFDLDFLKWYITLTKKTLRQQMNEVKAAFEEIKENQFIIKDYRVANSHFEVLFYEDIEKRKLIFKNTILSLPEYLSN